MIVYFLSVQVICYALKHSLKFRCAFVFATHSYFISHGYYTPMVSVSKATSFEGKQGEDSVERAAVCHTAQTTSSDVEQQSPRTFIIPTSPPHRPSLSPFSVKKDSSQSSQTSVSALRTFSHSLLSNSSDLSVISRKSKFADSETMTAVGRASISMPPPITKPSNHKPPVSRQNTTILANSDSLLLHGGLDVAVEGRNIPESSLMDDIEKIRGISSSRSKIASEPCARSSPSDPTKPINAATVSTESDGHRSSFSSLYSLSSAVYNVAAGGTSAPSSNAGSVKSGTLDQPIIAPLLGASHLASNKPEISPATTATDPISVTANSRSPHAGLRIT